MPGAIVPRLEELKNAQEVQLAKDVEAMLSTMKWRERRPSKSIGRQNVHGQSVEPYRAFALGKVRQYDRPGELVNSQFNAKYPELLKLLRALIKEHNPDFKYNAIQLNCNVQTNQHHDKHNVGPSYCFAVGTYSGGGVAIYPTGGAPYVLRNRRRWVYYDAARTLHASAPVTSGTRYAVIFYRTTPIKLRSPNAIRTRSMRSKSRVAKKKRTSR